MYHVPVNRPPHDSRRRLPMVGALQGALYGFIRAMSTGAVLGGLGMVVSVAIYTLDSQQTGSALTLVGGFFFWMMGVMVLGGVPAAIIGLLTGLAIGIQLRRLDECNDALARRIGTRTSWAGVAVLHLIVVPTCWGILRNDGNLAGLLIGLLVLIWLPCLIYIVTAGRFATLLHRQYPTQSVGGRDP